MNLSTSAHIKPGDKISTTVLPSCATLNFEGDNGDTVTIFLGGWREAAFRLDDIRCELDALEERLCEKLRGG